MLTLSAALTLALGALPRAEACAMLVHSTSTLAESAEQQALFVLGADGSSTVTYRVSWEGDAADFGWVVAVPDSYLSLAEADPSIFTALEEQTNPTVYTENDDTGTEDEGCGCGAGKGDALAGGKGDTAMDNGVTLLDQGFSGTYSYTVVTADAAASLSTWLDDNGWSGDTLTETLGAYVAEGGWAFVLLRVESGGVSGGALPPITLSLSDNRMVFPSQMGRTAGPVELRTTLWVQAEGAASLSGWTSSELETIYADGAPEEAFQEALRDLSDGGPVGARTYTGESTLGYITRFDLLAPASAHTVDARFTIDSADGAYRDTTIYREGRSNVGAAGLLPLAALAWGLRRRRRAT